MTFEIYQLTPSVLIDVELLDIAALGTVASAAVAWVIRVALTLRVDAMHEAARAAVGLTIAGELLVAGSMLLGGYVGGSVLAWLAEHPATAYGLLFAAYVWVRQRRLGGKPILPLPEFGFPLMVTTPIVVVAEQDGPRPLTVQDRRRHGLARGQTLASR
jgi:hypothetical protein